MEKKGFSHLEAVERLFVARHRFKMLSGVLFEILQLNEQKKAFVNSHFFKTAHRQDSCQLLLETMVNYEVAQICRIWDGVDPTGFSIPTIADLLHGDDVRKELVPDESGSTVIFNPEKRELIDAVFDEALAEAIKVSQSDELFRIKTYRNKRIAHPIYRTREEKKKSVTIVQSEDIEYAVENAYRIVEVLESALSISPSNFGLVRVQVSRTLEEFYGGLRANGN
jgi:AbiU2